MQNSNKLREKKLKSNTLGLKIIDFFIRDDIVQVAESIQSVLATKIQESDLAGLGWSLEELLRIKINIAKLNPMRAGCNIDLP